MSNKAVEVVEENVPQVTYEDIGGLTDEVKKIRDNQIDKNDKKGIMGKLGQVVQYVINCCKE